VSYAIGTFPTMPWCVYTREVLAAAVAASVSMAAVLRHLGLPLNGGSHAHLRRRITALDIDTTHFLGRAHLRGTPNTARRTPEQVLVVRHVGKGRAAPHTLRRALMASGRTYQCERCGIDGKWNGEPLGLHVDHIDGRFLDCRPENLRFLCPNRHSQTPTYAGRNRRRPTSATVYVDGRGDPVEATSTPRSPLSEKELEAVLSRISTGEIGVTEAARLIGCYRNHVYRLRKRLSMSGSVVPAQRRASKSEAYRESVLRYALRHPQLGPRKIAAGLLDQGIELAHGPVATTLAAARLSTRAARARAASEVGEDRLHRLGLTRSWDTTK
jgi:hypothetical protein